MTQSNIKPLKDLVEPGWANALAEVEPQVHRMGDFLRGEIAAGRRYLPASANILRAFTIPFDSIKVLIVGQDPYPTPGHPVGLSFCVAPDVQPIPRSLTNIYKELTDDLGVPMPTNGDLTPWTNQGVMLLNRCLTVEASIPVSYIDSDKLRLEAYRKLAGARTEADLDELRDELTDRYGKPPVDFEALFDVARLRFKARKLGITEIIGQGRNVRVAKFEPRESVQMRMARIYKGIQYRPMTKTYLIPAPFAGSLGSGPMSSDEIVGWTNQLLDDLDWKPTPRK